MTPIQEAGDWKGRPIWVTIEFRKLLRGYHVTEKPKRPRQPDPSLYSCLHRRQLSLLQQALTQLGGGRAPLGLQKGGGSGPPRTSLLTLLSDDGDGRASLRPMMP